MGDRGLTRRGLLGVAGGSLAALGRVPGVLAAPTDHGGRSATPAGDESSAAAPRLTEQPLGRLGAGVTTIPLEDTADLLALAWRDPPGARPQLRFRTPGGRWSQWVAATHGAHEDSSPAVGRGILGEPVWAGGTRLVQLHSTHSLAGARLYVVDASAGIGAARLAAAEAHAGTAAAAPPPAGPELAAGPGQPAIIAREFWARGHCPPRVAPGYGAVELGFVHHTETPNGYSAGEVPAMLRSIYVFHRFGRGWNDIGYNFVLDRFGRIFEARAGGIDEAVVGAHAGGYNTCSTGIAMLGSFMSIPISPRARTSLQQLLAWKLSLHGVPAVGHVTVTVDPAGAIYSRFPGGAEVSLPRIAGHRDADTTDCPGNILYGELPAIRTSAQALAGTPVQATIETLEGELVGALTLLDGTPLGGQPVTLQSRSVSRRGEVVVENPAAQVVTDAEGQWALPEGPSTVRRAPVRALFAGSGPYGAGVSAAIPARLAPPVAPSPVPAA